MLSNMLLAVVMLVVTTAIHAGGMTLAIRAIQHAIQRASRSPWWRRLLQVCTVVVVMFLASVCEVAVWAVVYVGIGALETFEKALYFSMVTFTTLGYGDIYLDENWRLLTSFEAATGIIMFGWTTAIVLSSVQRIYFPSSDFSTSNG